MMDFIRAPKAHFLRTYGKLAGLFAAAAFVLSFVTGIAARNSVATIVLRAVLLAVLFSGLGVGLQFVVKKFLPELSGAPGAPADERPPGSSIDIVLPEESPLGAERVEEAAPADAGEGGEAGEVQEVGDEAGPVETLEEAGDQGTAISEEPTDVSQAEESGAPAPPDQPVVGTAEQASQNPRQSSSLDALPDIGSLEASGPTGTRSRASRRVGRGASAEEAMRSLAVQEDPSTLARAIRTVLKREEKG
jgi:hypothetical protein